MVSSVTRVSAPVTSLFFTVPYPTTTTSSRPMVSSSSRMLKTLCVPMMTSWGFIPTKEKSRTLARSGTVRVKFPDASVTVPTVVPFTTTVAPGIAIPFLSLTFPRMVRSCCINGASARLPGLLFERNSATLPTSPPKITPPAEAR